MIRTLFLNRICISLALLCGCAVLTAGAAWAEDDLPPTSQFFDEYDKNADGKVTKNEFGGSGEVFKLLDRDGDGNITPAELGLPADYKPARAVRKKAPTGTADGAEKKGEGRKGKGRKGKGGGKGKGGNDRGKKMRERMKAMDADGDGKVSREEWKGPPEAFDRFDRNKDGFIDKGDRPARGGAGRAGPGGAGPGGAGQGKVTPADQKKRVDAHFKKLDKDGDGKLGGDELPNPAMLQRADKDADGTLSREEFETLAKRRMQGMRRKGGDRPERGGPKGAGQGENGERRRGGRVSAGMLKRWDRDADGKVSPDEFPGREEAFKRFDADGDGFLTEADAKAAAKDKPKAAAGAPNAAPTTGSAPLIKSQDKDGDGRLNRGEFRGTNAEWRALDKDGNGWLTPEETGEAGK